MKEVGALTLDAPEEHSQRFRSWVGSACADENDRQHIGQFEQASKGDDRGSVRPVQVVDDERQRRFGRATWRLPPRCGYRRRAPPLDQTCVAPGNESSTGVTAAQQQM